MVLSFVLFFLPFIQALRKHTMIYSLFQSGQVNLGKDTLSSEGAKAITTEFEV